MDTRPVRGGSFPDYLYTCQHPACARLTTAEFCCQSCRVAYERGYEIHEHGPLAHSERCDDRQASRTMPEVAEAVPGNPRACHRRTPDADAPA
jgi:hypothetical protein